MKRILAILPSKVLYGKERANIEVFTLAKEKLYCQFYVVVNRQANNNLREAVADLNTLPIIAPERHNKKYRLLTFIWTFIIGNIQLLYYLIKVRPNLLMMNSEIAFYDFYPALLFYNGKLLYRVGDKPGAYHQLSVHAYNNYVWKHYVLKRVTRVVCNSRYIYNCFTREGRDMNHDTIIYNYPPSRKPCKKDESILYSENTSKSISFGFLGQVFFQKGVHHYVECALKILETHPNIKFYVAGSLDYMPDYAVQVQNMVPYKWKCNIVFLGEIANIETFFQHVDVLCVPSIKQEPLANVLVEAKKYACPCIIYPTGGSPELIRHKVDGYVCDSASATSLLKGMNYYVSNRTLVIIHGKNSKESVVKLGIDRKHFEEKWIKVLKEMIE